MLKPKGINTKLHFAGGTLSVIIVSIILLTVFMNEKSKKDSLIINIAGKQRMLTQKMSKEMFYIKSKQSTDFRALNSATDLFENNLEDLLYGNNAKGIYPPQNSKIKLKLEEVHKLWKPFKKQIDNIEKKISLIKPDLESLVVRVSTLLKKSDNIVKVMVKHNMSGVFIDLSGRQRMLSQRMGFFLERYLRTDNAEDYINFLKAKELYNKTIQMFINDAKVQSIPEVNTVVKQTYGYWEKHKTYIAHMIKIEDEIKDSMDYIYEKNVKLLDTMDTAVWLYTDYSEEKNSVFVKFQYISLIIALLIILFAYILSREIVNHINEFVNKTKALENYDVNSIDHQHMEIDEESEDELIEASNYISGFVKKVNIAMNHSDDAIKKAESAVSELQHLADNVELAMQDLDIDKKEKASFDKKVNATEDIAIESAENLIHVRKMLEKLQQNLNNMMENSQKQK